MCKQKPIIRQTVLLNDWVIITKYKEEGGVIIADRKHTIPKKTIEHITNQHLLSQIEGLEKGFTYKVKFPDKEKHVKITVEWGN